MDNEIIAHYKLQNDDEHFVDAEYHNEYERCMIKQIKKLDHAVKLEVTSKMEGSLKDYYRITYTDKNRIGICKIKLSAFLAMWTTELPQNIDKEKYEQSRRLIENDEITQECIENYLANNKEFRLDRSRYYNTISQDDSIVSLSIDTNNLLDTNTTNEIEKKDFEKMILPETSKTESVEVETTIYVNSPVLLKGNRTVWYGICQHEPITFKIEDKDFLKQVYDKEIKFGSGTAINCRMKLVKEYKDGYDEPKITRIVVLVKTWYDDEHYQSETKKYKKIKIQEQQPSLFPEFNNKTD